MDGNIRDVLENSVIYDRRVVSFKWLTWKLDVHPNVAKEHLQRFLNEQEADGSNVAGHSIVTGVKDKVYRIILTPRKHVEKAKKCLTSVTGVHVYSAEPANLEMSYCASTISLQDVEGKLRDAATKCEQPTTSPIHCDAALETRSFAKLPLAAAKANQSSTLGKASAQVSMNFVVTSKSTKTDKPDSASKSSKGKPKQNELAAMFSKARAASAISKAVSKSSEKPASTEKSREPVKNTKSPPPDKSKVATKPKELASAPKPTTPKKKVKAEAPGSPESPVRSKKMPKRKVISDSEEEEDTPTPTASSSDAARSSDRTSGSTGDAKKPPTSSEDQAPKERSRKRRRVMKSIQQTFKDEEGYLVTKTVKQMVSESDDDEEDPIPKSVKEQVKRGGASKKAAAAQGDKKQQSLLSFFGKK
ncbi:unnamed protein product [Ixodes hexagonus]